MLHFPVLAAVTGGDSPPTVHPNTRQPFFLNLSGVLTKH